MANEGSAPLGGRILTRPFRVLVVVAGIGLVLIAVRFARGIGAVTALNDGYPWGLWIAWDVVTGTAIACGGYAMAILIYLFNRGRYHPLIRPAILTSALGYTLAGVSVVLDVGRWWVLWKVPTFVPLWNLDSALLEVALCIMAYTVVLWLELAPAFLERFEADGSERLRRLAARTRGPFEKGLPWLLALGMLLPTMHQSSLGSLMMLAGDKLHPLWQTPWLPLLFLVSCIAMGYAAVVIESTLSSALFGRRSEVRLLGSMSDVIRAVLAAFVVLRLGDLALRGDVGLAFRAENHAVLFWLELGLLAAPLWLLRARAGTDAGTLFRAAMAILLGGALYRFDVYLVAYSPGSHWQYFPSVPELLITAGVIALEILAWLVLVKKFPILSGAPPRTARSPA